MPISRLTTVDGQPSWRLANSHVQANVTRLGGHLGPVKFKFGRRTIEPFSVAPWAQEKPDPKLPAIIRALRGDFFCLPFGGNGTAFNREKHPVHGETANAKWKFESLRKSKGQTTLHLSLDTKIRRGRMDKRLSLIDGHRAVYCRHVISKMIGPMNFGHHAMVRFPDEPASGVVSTSPFIWGRVFPDQFENPEAGGYTSLRSGAEFTSLENVPLADGRSADLTRFPARRGFEDLVMIVADQSQPLAWTAVTFPKQRYVWFALKDPRVLHSTVLWISNGGRHYTPWNGRHINVIGLEEVTSYFHYGLAESVAENPLSHRGIETKVDLTSSTSLIVNYIMAVAEIPAGFDRVGRIEASEDKQSVKITSDGEENITVPIDTTFLYATQDEPVIAKHPKRHAKLDAH